MVDIAAMTSTTVRQLNIKRPRTHALADELARRRGISLAAAVETALEETLAREPKIEEAKRAQIEERVERLMALIEGSAELWGDKRNSKEIMDDLYDENGLPV